VQDLLGGLVIEARKAEQVAEYPQHLPARTRFAHRHAAPVWLCHNPSQFTYVPEVSANVPIGSNRWATRLSSSLANGVTATTNSALARVRRLSGASASIEGSRPPNNR